MTELATMATALQAAGYPARVMTGQPDTVPEQLEVAYGEDELGRDRLLHITPIPSPAEEVTATRFMKFAVSLPFQIPGEKRAEMAQAIAIVNAHLATGHFGLDANNALHYEYTLALPETAAIDGDMLVELVALTEFQQSHFGDYLEGVGDDEVSILVLDKLIKETT